MRRLIFATLLFISCGTTQPVSFKPGDYSCDFCRMSIVDMRFKAEILSPKGKIYRFDSIECMESWAKLHSTEVASQWITDFSHPERWLDFKKALILKREGIRSPMGEKFGVAP